MPPIYLRESDVDELIDMPGAIAALKRAFLAQAANQAENVPERGRAIGARVSNIMSAGASSGRFGFKAYAGTKAPTVYHVMLYDAEHGLVAIIEARRLSRLRTGAATGVATDRLAPQGAMRLGMIGAGEQAHTQLAAVAAVRPLKEALVFARNTKALDAFCDASSRALGIEVTPARSAKVLRRQRRRRRHGHELANAGCPRRMAARKRACEHDRRQRRQPDRARTRDLRGRTGW